ncbi:unnamed protein product [Durusdinium trenchii]|uniref:Resolvase/invertase-type recombinase catalytic domain-containing protein n=1 Tax=Durusdinium trenchii TaxID=1381693 RepID=A0ABP0M0L6_9DINO
MGMALVGPRRLLLWNVSSQKRRQLSCLEDVDGVLTRGDQVDLDPTLVRRLSQVVRDHDAGVVLTTQRRKTMRALNHVLRGLSAGKLAPGRILGVTPSLCGSSDCCVEEIRSWLAANKDLAHANWVAVDDKDLTAQDPEFLRGHFLRTDFAEGLTQAKTDELSSMLVKAARASSKAAFRDWQRRHAAVVAAQAVEEAAHESARPRGSYREELQRQAWSHEEQERSIRRAQAAEESSQEPSESVQALRALQRGREFL